MGFNIKDHMLPVGSLIRFEAMTCNQQLSYVYNSIGIKSGDIALVLEHKKPFLVDLLIGDKIMHLDLEHMVDRIGWVPELTPIYCGSGFREYPRWYPKYCYNYEV